MTDETTVEDFDEQIDQETKPMQAEQQDLMDDEADKREKLKFHERLSTSESDDDMDDEMTIADDSDLDPIE